MPIIKYIYLFLTIPSITLFSEKVFAFLSKDEVENLKQEEEKKIATLQRSDKRKALVHDYEEYEDYDNDGRRHSEKCDDDLNDSR